MPTTPRTKTPANELSARTRSTNLERMRREVFDLAVIGGGITGAGVALDAASRGLTVALVEKGDFAGGTSSRSSKLIHGGLRYLEQFDIGLVRESLHERAVLAQMAPHLCTPLEFLVPLYASGERSPLGANRLRLSAGLWLYDLLAGRRNIGRHRWLSREAALNQAPMLDPRDLRGAFVYYDCLTDDARLVIEVIKAAAAHGALVANYVTARGLRKDEGGISIIDLQDTIASGSLELRSRVVINATGVWSDEVSRLSDANAPKRLRPSKGIHIVVASERLQNRTAVLIPSVGEKRFLFVIPWRGGRTIIGTTDTDYQGNLDDPRAESEEVDRVLQSAVRAFPEARLTNNDVISTFAGLRPLIAANERSTKELSRKEEIFEDKSGLITITGGKLTTWRKMAEQVADLVVRRLENIDGGFRTRTHRSVTEHIQLAGGTLQRDSGSEAERAAAEFNIDIATAEHLMASYGGNYRVVLELTRASEELKRTLIVGLPHIEAEAVYAARYEMAVTANDFLSRRTRIDLLAGERSHSCAMRVTRLLDPANSSAGVPDMQNTRV